MKDKFVLLLSSSINPKNYSFVGRKGSEQRLKDYETALKFYISKGYKIVFVDNTEFSLIDDSLKKEPSLEFYSFLSRESYKGKGHGELEIIDFALCNSSILKDVEVFVKISGRYVIENIDEICSQILDWENFHYCNFSRNLIWADTRIMILTKNFYYDYFRPTCDNYLDEPKGIMFEKVYSRAIHLWMYRGNRVKLLPFTPFYKAYNGENNVRIYFSNLKKVKYFLFHKLKIWVFNQFV